MIPLVVHHGSHPWDGPVQLADLLDLDPGAARAAGRCLPRLEFLLDDLAGVGEQQLRDRPLTASAQITLLLLKIAAGNPRLVADLAPWADQLRSIAGQPGGTETLVARDLRPTREQRAMVTGDAGLDKLNRWFDRALTAATAADVFKDDKA